MESCGTTSPLLQVGVVDEGLSMGNYCPYTNSNVVYLKCQECEDKICEKDWFFCGVAGTPLSMMKSRMQMSEYLDRMLAKREKAVKEAGTQA